MTPSNPPASPEPVHTPPTTFADLNLIFDTPAVAAAASDPVGQDMITVLSAHPEGVAVLASLGIHIRSSAESTADRSTPPMIVDHPQRSYAISTRDHPERDRLVIAAVAMAQIDPADLTRADRLALHRAFLAVLTVTRAHGMVHNMPNATTGVRP